VALIGNAAVGALRKVLSQYNIGSAQQVGLATLLQGTVAILQCVYYGDLEIGPNFVESLPPRIFWIAAVTGSVLNSVVKTLETKAFSETDMSLCVPFLAFDPVMQFVVGVVVMPVACSMVGFGCDEAGKTYPIYHVLSVLCIASGAFMLGRGTGGKVVRKPGTAYLGPLPMGSWFILFNCVIYGFTSRLDKVTTLAHVRLILTRLLSGNLQMCKRTCVGKKKGERFGKFGGGGERPMVICAGMTQSEIPPCHGLAPIAQAHLVCLV
jgi:hypothetical protein